MEKYDVVIVGAGLAGLQCARLLGERRLWMRRVIAAVQMPALVELGCAAFRLPVLDAFAWHVFFGRGSFPEIDLRLVAQPAV